MTPEEAFIASSIVGLCCLLITIAALIKPRRTAPLKLKILPEKKPQYRIRKDRELWRYPGYRIIRLLCQDRKMPMPMITIGQIPPGQPGATGAFMPPNMIFLMDPYDVGVAVHEWSHYWGQYHKGNPAYYNYR